MFNVRIIFFFSSFDNDSENNLDNPCFFKSSLNYREILDTFQINYNKTVFFVINEF